jgi:hypothetical protein
MSDSHPPQDGQGPLGEPGESEGSAATPVPLPEQHANGAEAAATPPEELSRNATSTSRRAVIGAAFGASLVWAPKALAKTASTAPFSHAQEAEIRALIHDELAKLDLLHGPGRGPTGPTGPKGPGSTGPTGRTGPPGATGP